ncbi:hypothetical protein BJ546DRAFT_223196 [Cryomyces antarcticus]
MFWTREILKLTALLHLHLSLLSTAVVRYAAPSYIPVRSESHGGEALDTFRPRLVGSFLFGIWGSASPLVLGLLYDILKCLIRHCPCVRLGSKYERHSRAPLSSKNANEEQERLGATGSD